MNDPDWLVQARAEGRITERGVGVLPTAPRPRPVAQPPGNRPPRPVRNVANCRPRANWSFTIEVPECTVVSEINRREHWAPKARRKKEQCEALVLALAFGPPIVQAAIGKPLTVTWTRVGRMGRRQQQDDDNLRSAFKGLRDKLAELLHTDDGESLIVWDYQQEAGKPGVKLTIATRV